MVARTKKRLIAVLVFAHIDHWSGRLRSVLGRLRSVLAAASTRHPEAEPRRRGTSRRGDEFTGTRPSQFR